MRTHVWCMSVCAATTLTAIICLPAHAGWGVELGRLMVTTFARQAANRLIDREIYGRRPAAAPSYRHYSQAPPPAPPRVVHKQSSGQIARTASAATHKSSSLSYPHDESLVPPPPPYPVVYPGGPDTSDITNASMEAKKPVIVPPPPPAPSLWAEKSKSESKVR